MLVESPKPMDCCIYRLCHGLSGWISRPLGCLVLLLMANAPPVVASPQNQFTAAFTVIRRQDNSISSVRMRILADGETLTGCGRVTVSDLVGLYCSKDRTVYTNQSTLMLLEKNFGRGALRYLAAHELAHGRQHAVTGFSRTLIWSSVVDELQADCIAGAYLRQAFGINTESAEVPGIMAFAETIGNYSIFEQDWHGTPSWRRKAVSRGLNQGDPASCLSSNRINYGALMEQGRQLVPTMQRLLQR